MAIMPNDCSKSETKNVTFSLRVCVRKTLHIDDFTEDEIDAAYYSRVDFIAFKQDMKRTLQKMETTNSDSQIDSNKETSESCCRGLEYQTKEASAMRFLRRRTACFAVIEAQTELVLQNQQNDRDTFTSRREYQRAIGSPGCYDDEKIAAAYAPYAFVGAATAHLMGLHDEAVAREVALLEQQQTPTTIGEAEDGVKQGTKQHSAEQAVATAFARWNVESTKQQEPSRIFFSRRRFLSLAA